MPELPDVQRYVEALAARVIGATLERVTIVGPNVLRTVEPRPEACAGRRVHDVRRMGKRIVLALDGDVYCVLHLMIAGRLQWLARPAQPSRRRDLAHFVFDRGTLRWTEAGTKKRASLHVVAGEAALRALDPGGLEVLDADAAAFREAMRRENRTLKRALTDPRILSGIGNAYSDEILHAARLSPMRRTHQLSDAELDHLFETTRTTLQAWLERLRAETGAEFPARVTAFHPQMAVHGKYRQPCPVCGTAIQRIVYAENESNYCPACQTGGRLLADRALSRLLREDWPRTVEELEELRRGAR